MAACGIHEIDEKYELIKCSQEAWEHDPEGLCLFHSRQPDKDQDGAFTEAVKAKMAEEDYDFQGVFFPGPFSLRELTGQEEFTFAKPADFSEATFQERADFSWATFKEADFSWATFTERATFFRATFREADFSRATFQERADFFEATFQKAHFVNATLHEARFSNATFKEANFSGVTFQKADFLNANFQEARFSKATFQKANFSGATFQEANFIETTFQEAHFLGAKINGQMTLAGIMKNKPWPAYFRFIQFGGKGILRFEDLSLARVEFTGTDLRQVEFDRVTWASWWGRFAVYDEILLHQRRWVHIAYWLKHGGFWRLENKPKSPPFTDFAPVERLYRQLKTNYEEERDFKRVGDFHYGEMEMHRRGSFLRQWVPSWYNFYRVLSGYGERPLRAFIWLLLLIPAWSGLVWGLGMNQAGSQDPVSYGNTLFFILEKALLQRPEWPKGITGLGKFLGSLSVLLLPGQAALFILALRNRLGRRR